MTCAPHVATSPGTASPSPWRRGAVPLVLGAAAAVAAGVLVVRSPYAPLSYGICPSVLLLGVSCPGCGGLRATHSLLTGDLAGAWAANPLWVLVAPLLAAAWGVWLVRRLGARPPVVLPAVVGWVALGVVVAFGVLRNVPALVPFLGPSPVP